MIEKSNTEVIYLRGNHDDFLDNVLPLQIGSLSIQREYVLHSNGKKYWVIHGDVFDGITSNLKWLAKLGDVGYTFLLWLNKIYNNRRVRKGIPYYSLSQIVKQKVKTAVSYISDFEKTLVDLAVTKGYDGVICGHIHHPAIVNYNGIEYMNSGDWVETLSALVEDQKGNWEILYYADFLEMEQTLEHELRQEKTDYYLKAVQLS